MSTLGIDAKGYLTGWLMALVDMTSKDIRAIPEDQWEATFGGCSKSSHVLTCDAIAMLKWTTEALNGNVTAVTGSYVTDALKDACSTREGACGALAGAAQAFAGALSAASDEALNGAIIPPWQMPTPLFMVAQIAVGHVWYHDGQLNYIQTLLGDDKVHWM